MIMGKQSLEQPESHDHEGGSGGGVARGGIGVGCGDGDSVGLHGAEGGFQAEDAPAAASLLERGGQLFSLTARG
jgi:hypothetical protein